jgi:hypothetical protein
MNRIALSLLTLGLSLAPVQCRAAEPKTEEAKAIAEIVKLMGKITVAEDTPRKRVISIDLTKGKVTDAGLAHVRGFPRLRDLNLGGCHKITDAGLIHLKGLTKLQLLSLLVLAHK